MTMNAKMGTTATSRGRETLRPGRADRPTDHKGTHNHGNAQADAQDAGHDAPLLLKNLVGDDGDLRGERRVERQLRMAPAQRHDRDVRGDGCDQQPAGPPIGPMSIQTRRMPNVEFVPSLSLRKAVTDIAHRALRSATRLRAIGASSAPTKLVIFSVTVGRIGASGLPDRFEMHDAGAGQRFLPTPASFIWSSQRINRCRR